MASLCLQFPVNCYKPGPTRSDHNGDPIASRLGVDPQLEKLAAPPGSRLPHLTQCLTEDFLACLGVDPQIQKARDVVPPPPPDPPAPSPPPSGSPSEPAASTAEVTNDPAGLPVPLGSPPPSPPPSPRGSDDEDEGEPREAAAGGGGPAQKPAPKKRARKHAAPDAAAGRSADSTSVRGFSDSKRQLTLVDGGSGSKGQLTLAWKGRESDDASSSNGPVAAAAEEEEPAAAAASVAAASAASAAAGPAAAAEAAEEPSAAADGDITPEEGLEALRGAVNLFEPTKSKPENVPFAPLIEATRATDFGPAALTSSSSREDIKAACKSLASKLDSLENLDGPQQEKRRTLVLRLKWPSAPLLEAFAKELRAGEGGAAGGEAAQAAEAVLATRRTDVARIVIKPTEATGKDACVKMKALFRDIRIVDHEVWAASAGNELAKANAAIERNKEVIDKATGECRLEENNLEVPKSVVEKWTAALLEAYGPTCKLTNVKKVGGNKPNVWTIGGWHVYKFVLAGTGAPAADAGIDLGLPLPPLVASGPS